MEFYAVYNDIPIIDDYKIIISVNNLFPGDIPKVWEISKKIPHRFGHFFTDGTLCLGVRTEILQKLAGNPSLLYFVDTFVINYLYTASYWMKYGTMPFGERSHRKGIYEFYKERLDVDTDKEVLLMLKAISNKNFRYRGHLLCPCMSGKTMRTCKHNEFLLGLDSFKISLYKKDYEYLSQESEWDIWKIL